MTSFTRPSAPLLRIFRAIKTLRLSLSHFPPHSTVLSFSLSPSFSYYHDDVVNRKIIIVSCGTVDCGELRLEIFASVGVYVRKHSPLWLCFSWSQVVLFLAFCTIKAYFCTLIGVLKLYKPARKKLLRKIHENSWEMLYWHSLSYQRKQITSILVLSFSPRKCQGFSIRKEGQWMLKASYRKATTTTKLRLSTIHRTSFPPNTPIIFFNNLFDAAWKSNESLCFPVTSTTIGL